MDFNVAKRIAGERFINELLKNGGMTEKELKRYVKTKHFDENVELLAADLLRYLRERGDGFP